MKGHPAFIKRLISGTLFVLFLGAMMLHAQRRSGEAVTHTSNTSTANASTHVESNSSAQKVYVPQLKGATVQQLKDGRFLQKRADGGTRELHDTKHGMDIHHGLDGGVRVTLERKDHSRLVAEQGRPGYVERPFTYLGHDFARRTFYYQGKTYSNSYRSYRYNGSRITVYAPSRYYSRAFYGWLFNMWSFFFIYDWDWAGEPWVSFDSGYFAPSPTYASASLWLTDYLLSNELAVAYEVRRVNGTLPTVAAAATSAPAITAEVKQKIANEIKVQIQLENYESKAITQEQDLDAGASSIAHAYGDGRTHVFVVGYPLDVVDTNGTECALTEGDVVQLSGPPNFNTGSALVAVLASNGRKDCAKNSTVMMGLADTQEMQNRMRETIDLGIAELREKQGKKGWPVIPAEVLGTEIKVKYMEFAPPASPNDQSDIAQQLLQEASKAETEMLAKGTGK